PMTEDTEGTGGRGGRPPAPPVARQAGLEQAQQRARHQGGEEHVEDREAREGQHDGGRRQRAGRERRPARAVTMAASAEGNRAANSLTPRPRKAAAMAQNCSTGLSRYGRGFKRGQPPGALA